MIPDEQDERPEEPTGGFLPKRPDPPSLDVAHADDQTVIIYRWGSWSAGLRLILGMALLGMPGLVLATAESAELALAPLAIPLLLGVVVLYSGAAGLVNHTVIAVRGGVVEVTTGPLPVHLRRAVALEEVALFGVDRKIRMSRQGGRRGSWKPRQPTRAELSQTSTNPFSRVVITFTLVAVYADSTHTVLVSGLPSLHVALAIKNHLERARRR